MTHTGERVHRWLTIFATASRPLTCSNRHPYIELLGTIYLMKLRYGTKFGSNAGSCWRLIFVYALFPWMQRYRVFNAPSKTSEQGFSITEEDFSTVRLDKAPVNTSGRSSSFATPALLKSSSRGSVVTFDTLRSSLHSVRSENEKLRQKVEELQASRESVDTENESLRKRVQELELALRQKEASDAEEITVANEEKDDSSKWFT